MLRSIFLIAQPPLLGEEGKIRHSAIARQVAFDKVVTVV
jgi:hypothetical protein